MEKGKDTKHVKRLIHSLVNRHTAAVEDPVFTLEEKPCDNELRPIIMKLAVIYCKSKNSLLALERMRCWFVVCQCDNEVARSAYLSCWGVHSKLEGAGRPSHTDMRYEYDDSVFLMIAYLSVSATRMLIRFR